MGREPTRPRTAASTDWISCAIPRLEEPRELLAWLAAGDPLGIGRLGQRRLARAAYLLDPQRLFLRVLARVALEGASRHPPRGRARARWLTQLVDESVFELLEEDRSEQAEGIEPAMPTDARYARVARELECSELEARKICVAYNALPTESRGMFQAVHVRQRELAQAARELGLELAAARLHLDEALEALCPTRPC